MKRTTKKTLAASLLSLLLCVAMLIGSTYAWFSDTASTSAVKITAGNLDVEVTDENGDPLGTEPNNLIDTTKCDPNKVEPGMMLMTKAFKIKNAGSLALVYTLTIDATTTGSKDLSKVIKMKVIAKPAEGEESPLPSESADLKARQDFWKKIGAADETEGKIDELTTGVIYPESGKGVAKPQDSQDAEGSTGALVAILFWDPTENDNDYNLNDISGENALKVEYTLNVFATQTPAEKDSFGEKYDNGLVVATAQALNDALDAVKGTSDPVNIVLGGDIDNFTPKALNAGSTIDGNGHTISGSNANSTVFQVVPTAGTKTTFKNLTIENTAPSGKNWGMIIGNNENKNKNGEVVFENCTIKAENAYALGVNNGAKVHLKNCTLEGWSGLEIADGSEVTLENCTLTGTNTKDGDNNLYGVVNLWGTNCKLTIKGNVTITAVKTNGAAQFGILGRDQARPSQITFDPNANLTLTENNDGKTYNKDNYILHTIGYTL